MGERAASSPPALARVSESPVVPAYEYDLGRYSRLVSTSSPDAQAWFDRGLNWSYGFNHEEAVRCFERAVDADPSCAMAHWGIAYAMGPNYNKDWIAFEPDELIEMVALARAAVERAHSLLDHATPVERALIEALGARFPAATPPAECSLWSDAYADAMRAVYSRFGDDLDVATLFAEALIGRTPWQLWNLQTGEPAEGADTREALAVLERGIASSPEPHPGLLHLYLHRWRCRRFPSARCRRPTGCAGSCPTPGTCSTCRPTSTCCAAATATSSRGTSGRSWPTASTSSARARSTSTRSTAATTTTSRCTARCSSARSSRRSRRPTRWPRRSARSC